MIEIPENKWTPDWISAFRSAVGNWHVLNSAFSKDLYGNKNGIYYGDHLAGFSASLLEMIERAEIPDPVAHSLKGFVSCLHGFLYATLNLLFIINKRTLLSQNFEDTATHLKNLYSALNEIKRMDAHVNNHFLNKDDEDALYVKRFCDVYLGEALATLNFFSVDMMNSPVAGKIVELKSLFSTSAIGVKLNADYYAQYRYVNLPNFRFSDLINVHPDRRLSFMNDLHSILYLEKGAKMSVAMAILVESNVLKMPNNSVRALYRAMEQEFTWDIGSYVSIQKDFNLFRKDEIDPKHKGGQRLAELKVQIAQLVSRHKTPQS